MTFIVKYLLTPPEYRNIFVKQNYFAFQNYILKFFLNWLFELVSWCEVITGPSVLFDVNFFVLLSD